MAQSERKVFAETVTKALNWWARHWRVTGGARSLTLGDLMAGKKYYWKREPHEVLQFIGEHGGDRKLRLFAAAWCRLWPDSSPAGTLIEAAESLADGRTSPQDFAGVVKATSHDAPCPRIAALIEVCTASEPFGCYMTASDVSNGLLHGAKSPAVRRALVERARCILGPPGRLKREAWVTPTALALARDLYDKRDFSLLRILADVLEEAGCRNKPVLDHCRQPGEHIRGCWVVDLVLGMM